MTSYRIPLRIKSICDDAKLLEEKGMFFASAFCYCTYIEQYLLYKYISALRDKNPISAKQKQDQIFKIKDDKKLTFGRITELINVKNKNPIIYPNVDRIKSIRNTLIAHSFFVTPLDKNNKYKLAFYDVNNHLKFIRRIYVIIKTEEISKEDKTKIERFLKNRLSPLARIKTIEEESLEVELVILRIINKVLKKNIKTIETYYSGKDTKGTMLQYMPK